MQRREMGRGGGRREAKEAEKKLQSSTGAREWSDFYNKYKQYNKSNLLFWWTTKLPFCLLKANR